MIAGTTAESKVEYVSPASVAMAQTSLTSEEARDFKVHPALRNYAYLDTNGEIKYRPALLSREESVQLIPGLKPYSYVAIDKNGEPKPFMHEDIKIKTEIYKADLIDYKDRRKAHESRIAEWEKGYALLLTQADKTKPETMEKLSQFEKSKPAPFDEQPPRDPLDENTDDLYRKNAAGSVKKYRINVNGVVKEYQMDKIEAAARNANMTIDQFMAEFGVK